MFKCNLYRYTEAGPRPAPHTLPRVVVLGEQRTSTPSTASDDSDNGGGGGKAATGAAGAAGEDGGGGGGDGLRIAWQYRRYLQQGKALDDSRVAGAVHVVVTRSFESAWSGFGFNP